MDVSQRSDNGLEVPSPRLARYRIAEALCVLANNAEQQVAFLDEAGYSVDELALTFDWALGLMWLPLEAGLIPEDTGKRLREIEAILSLMSGAANSELWTIEALGADHLWGGIRRLSAAALQDFQKLGIPIPVSSSRLFGPLESVPESERY